MIEFLKQLDTLFRKKIEAFVNRTLENREMFIRPVFWQELQREYEDIIMLGSNNIRNKFAELGLGTRWAYAESRQQTQEYVERSSRFCFDELKAIIQSKIRDINYYLSRHFKNDFNFDEKKVPRNWPSMAEEDIDQLYVRHAPRRKPLRAYTPTLSTSSSDSASRKSKKWRRTEGPWWTGTAPLTCSRSRESKLQARRATS